MTENPEQVE